MAVSVAVIQLEENTLRTEGTHTVTVTEGPALLRLHAVDGLRFRLEIQDGFGVGEA